MGDAAPGEGEGGHLVVDVVDALLACLAAEPVEHGAAVEIAFVDGVVRACDDAVEGVEGPFGGDLVGCHDPGGRAKAVLHGGVRPQRFGEGGGVGEVEIAEGVEVELFGGLGILHEGAEVADEVDAELADADIHLGSELLADAGIGVRGGGELVGRVAFDDEDAAAEGGVARRPPGGRGADHRAADDDEVVGSVRGGCRHGLTLAISSGERP